MKKSIILFSTALILILGVGLLNVGVCLNGRALQNPATGYETALNGTLSGNFWGIGTGNPTNGLGNDDGGLAITGWVHNFAPGDYYIFYNTQNASDGCIDTGTPPNRCFVAIYDSYNDGAATHAGNAIFGAVALSGSTWNFDGVFNGTAGGNVMGSSPLPVPAAADPANYVDNGDGTWTFDVTAPAPVFNSTGDPLNGSYDSAPASPIITSWQVYYAVGAVPTSASPASYSAATMGATSMAGATWTSTITVTWDGTTPLHMTSGLGLDSGYSTGIVSANSIPINQPFAQGVFASVSADKARRGKVATTWTSSVEEGVLGYNVYYAGKVDGNYRKANGTLIASQGTGSSYDFTFRPAFRKAAKRHAWVKVEAVKADGSSVFTNPMKVTFR